MGSSGGGIDTRGATPIAVFKGDLEVANFDGYSIENYASEDLATDRKLMCKGPVTFFSKPSESSERLVKALMPGLIGYFRKSSKSELKTRNLSKQIHAVLASNFPTKVGASGGRRADFTENYDKDVRYIANLLLQVYGGQIFKQESRAKAAGAAALGATTDFIKTGADKVIVAPAKAVARKPVRNGLIVAAAVGIIGALVLLTGNVDDAPRQADTEQVPPEPPKPDANTPSLTSAQKIDLTELKGLIDEQSQALMSCAELDFVDGALASGKISDRIGLKKLLHQVIRAKNGDPAKISRMIDLAESSNLAEVDANLNRSVLECVGIMNDEIITIEGKKAQLTNIINARIAEIDRQAEMATAQAEVIDDILDFSFDTVDTIEMTPDQMSDRLDNVPSHLNSAAGFAMINGGDGGFVKALDENGKFMSSFLNQESIKTGTEFMVETNNGKRFLMTIASKSEQNGFDIHFQRYENGSLLAKKRILIP